MGTSGWPLPTAESVTHSGASSHGRLFVQHPPGWSAEVDADKPDTGMCPQLAADDFFDR